MNSLRISVRRAGSVFAALALALSTALPGIVSAAQVTERSIELSSASAGAEDVTYNVKFTAVEAADAFLIDFCNDSPLIGATCTGPTGMVVTAADSVSAGVTDVTGTGHQIVVTKPISAAENVDVVITGIDNPTSAGNLYARILTFDTANLGNYSSTDPDNGGANPYNDEGGVAMYITPTIAVSGAVLESLVFCVTGGQAPDENCDTSDPSVTAPTLRLGEESGGVVALSSGALSTGELYTQLSTNAAGGAIVSLKSNTLSCGGLMREGETDPAKGCGIAPAGASTFTAGTAKFGVRTATAAGVGANSNGTLRPFDNSGSPVYNNAGYALQYAAGNATGVTSTYGDPFLDTNDAPVNNMGMTLTFGASAANNTPAGNYKAELSLIATGKF